MTLKEYCNSCQNKGSHKCRSCCVKFHDGVLQSEPTKYKKEPQTNADRIRAMSDIELRDFLQSRVWNCETNKLCDECPLYHEEKGCLSMLEWLKQPAED